MKYFVKNKRQSAEELDALVKKFFLNDRRYRSYNYQHPMLREDGEALHLEGGCGPDASNHDLNLFCIYGKSWNIKMTPEWKNRSAGEIRMKIQLLKPEPDAVDRYDDDLQFLKMEEGLQLATIHAIREFYSLGLNEPLDIESQIAACKGEAFYYNPFPRPVYEFKWDGRPSSFREKCYVSEIVYAGALAKGGL